MDMQALSFQTHNWEIVEKTEHKGETGFAFWQTLHANNVRVRKVQYSAGYKADHWCSKGHIILCLEGEMITELDNGRFFTLTAGMTYFVGDNCEQHRSSSEKGCKLFIVD